MTRRLTNIQRVGAFMLKEQRPLYLREIIRGTRLSKNQAASALYTLSAADIVEGLGEESPGRARRFVIRDRAGLKERVDVPNRHGGGVEAGRKHDFGPLLDAWGAL